jgi:hypothetical protein
MNELDNSEYWEMNAISIGRGENPNTSPHMGYSLYLLVLHFRNHVIPFTDKHVTYTQSTAEHIGLL